MAPLCFENPTYYFPNVSASSSSSANNDASITSSCGQQHQQSPFAFNSGPAPSLQLAPPLKRRRPSSPARNPSPFPSCNESYAAATRTSKKAKFARRDSSAPLHHRNHHGSFGGSALSSAWWSSAWLRSDDDVIPLDGKNLALEDTPASHASSSHSPSLETDAVNSVARAAAFEETQGARDDERVHENADHAMTHGGAVGGAVGAMDTSARVPAEYFGHHDITSPLNEVDRRGHDVKEQQQRQEEEEDVEMSDDPVAPVPVPATASTIIPSTATHALKPLPVDGLARCPSDLDQHEDSHRRRLLLRVTPSASSLSSVAMASGRQLSLRGDAPVSALRAAIRDAMGSRDGVGGACVFAAETSSGRVVDMGGGRDAVALRGGSRRRGRAASVGAEGEGCVEGLFELGNVVRVNVPWMGVFDVWLTGRWDE